MPVLPGLRRIFRLALGRADPAQEFEEEMALHLALRAEELREEGLGPEEARREAERRFGDRRAIARTVRFIDRVAHRERRRRESMRRFLQDFRVAVRALVHQPGYALGAILIVALGVGASTAMFTVLNAAFLRPFAYPESDRLAYVWETSRSGGRMSAAGPNAEDWSRETRLFSALGYFANGQAVLAGDGPAEYVPGAAVSRPFLRVLGLGPLLGRWFAPEEARVGGPPVVVLSEGLWRRRFGADRGVIGRAIRLDGGLVTVVGVLPRAVAFPVGAELWRPAEPYNNGTSRTAHNWRVLARLAPGVTLSVAERDLGALTRRLVAEDKGGDDFVAAGVRLVPLRDELVGSNKTVLLLLQGAVLLVLLIAAVNLTNLTLARAVRRRSEVGVCLALGARRLDVIRRFTAENLLLTMVGGGLGFLVAAVLRGLLIRWVGRMIPFVGTLPLDVRVAGFAAGLAVLVGIGSSLVPALRASAGSGQLLATRGGTLPRAGSRLIDGLMAAEVALAVVLVAGAALVARSLAELNRTDPGFAVAGRVAMLVPFQRGEGSATPTSAAQQAALDRLLETLRSRPGTVAAVAASSLPIWSGSPNGSAQVEGAPSAAGGPPAVADFRIVSPGYFRALDIPVRRGREFVASDREDTPYAAVVNEAFVRAYLGADDPLSRRVRFPGMQEGEDPWAAVVGVVGDTRQDGLADPPVPAIYYSYRQRPSGGPMTVLVRSTAPQPAVLADLREALGRIDRGLPFTARSFPDIVARSLALPRIRSILLGLFALIALGLAAAGIMAVVAFAVAQRTREIGLRVAVGAPPGAILWNGVRRAAVPAILGLIVGLAGALALGRITRSLLFGITPWDPFTLAAAAGLTLFVSLVAAFVPARRALQVSPLEALRAE